MRGVICMVKRIPRWSMSATLKTLLLLFWALTLLLPLCAMLSSLIGTDVGAIITGRNFRKGLGNSLNVSCVSTVISIALAWCLAWCTTRTRIRFKGLFMILFSLPMLIPSISHGMGLIILFGRNGLVTNLLGLKSTIYGYWGIITGSVMYSFPVAYLMLYDVLKYEDSTPYEAAQVLGLSKLDRLRAITVPYLRKPLISVFFATFTMIITDYGIPLMIGGKFTTLPVIMYQDVIGLLDFGKGSVVGLVLLAPSLVACVLDMMNKDKGNLAYTVKPFAIGKSPLRDALAYALCGAVSLFVLLPIAVFVITSFAAQYPHDMSFSLGNVARAMDMGVRDYLGNSVIIALLVALLGTALAVVCAYVTARMRSKSSRLVHLMSITSLAVPGIVLGLSYVLFFKGSFLYGTFAILILVNMMHFFASPYLMMYNAFGKLNGNLESVGRTLGIPRWAILRDVLLPQTVSTMAEMATYFFVNSMMTISAVSFLANVGNKPVALMITQFEAQNQLESAAFVSLLILVINLAVKGLTALMKKKLA